MTFLTTPTAMEQIRAEAETLPPHLRRPFVDKAEQRLLDRTRAPVDPRTFIESPRYLNAKGVLYPEVMEAVIAICLEDWVVEAVHTGGIGSGKTTAAIYVMAYQLYLLSRMISPHSEMGLDPTSEIALVFQSKTLTLAYEVGYERFRALIETAPYFREHFPFDKNIKSKLVFPNRILVKPVVGEATGTLGQNIIGAVIDEMNFMETVEKSTRARDGESYDQAESLYNSLVMRRKTRFLQADKRMPGMLCLVSSKNYRGQFLDQKVEEAAQGPSSGVYVYDKRVWDIKPWEFVQGTFPVFSGDLTRKPRILDAGEELNDADARLVIEVPEEYRTEFERDILRAMRDLGGVSTTVVHPFIMEPEKVAACFTPKLRSCLSREACDFNDTQLQVHPDRYLTPMEPRFAHVDLALTGDSAGVAVGHVVGFRTVDRGQDIQEILPIVRFDCVLEVRPPRGGEILFSKIRDLLYALRRTGMNIRWVTYDSWQSRDSLQLLRQKGFMTGEQSLDKDMLYYDIAKGAMYDGRVYTHPHEKALKEFLELEVDAPKQKVDHPPNGSKDCSDAMAGVIVGLTLRRDVWARHGVRPTDIPRNLLKTLVSDEKS